MREDRGRSSLGGVLGKKRGHAGRKVRCLSRRGGRRGIKGGCLGGGLGEASGMCGGRGRGFGACM